MVADMRSRVTFFVIGLSRLSCKRGRGAIVIGDMDILRLMVYVQQVEKEKIRDKKVFKDKRVKPRNMSGHQKSNVNLSPFKHK